MKHRTLRIVWSVAWGTVAVLLIALWVRSYRWSDFYYPHQIIGTIFAGVTSLNGEIMLEGRDLGTYLYYGDQWRNYVSHPATEVHFPGRHYWFRFNQTGGRTGYWVILPMWFPILVSIGLGAGPSLSLRFSLRTLLIVTTLIAVGLGLIVWLTAK